MSDEIKRDRSPNYPKLPLEQAIELVAGLHKKAGKSQIMPQVAASALGYSGLNGAALTTIGAISQYGLIDRQRGEGISISQLAIRLVHPVNDAQLAASRREAALKPRVFSELFSGGFHHCSEDVLSNHLMQSGFTHDGARKATSVFLANVEFAKLQNGDNKLSDEPITPVPAITTETAVPETLKQMPQIEQRTEGEPSPATSGKKLLARYSVPLGSNEATITFNGEDLHPEDFDALAEYVDLFKKQFLRTQKAKESKMVSEGSVSV